MLNKIVLMGRLTADIEVNTTDSGKRVTNFTLAVDRDYTNKEGERDTDFIGCTAWEGRADFLREWFGKGDSIIVSGSLYVSQYDKDGEKRSYPYVAVSDIYFTGERKKNTTNVPQSEEPPAEKEPKKTKVLTAAEAFGFDEEGIPF